MGEMTRDPIMITPCGNVRDGDRQRQGTHQPRTGVAETGMEISPELGL